MLPPHRPKMPFGQLNVAMQIYNICKGRLWSGGGGGGRVVYAKEDIKYLTKIDHFARWLFLLYINYINSFTVHSVIIVADMKHASTYSPVAFRSVHTGIEPPFLLKIYYAITAYMTQGFTSRKYRLKEK